MPSSLIETDIGFPSFYEGEAVESKVKKILNYLFMLREDLRYTLANLGLGNFSDSDLIELGDRITEPIDARLEGIDGEITNLTVEAGNLASRMEDLDGSLSEFQQTLDGFTFTVKNPDGTTTTVDITGGGIDLTGLVTFTDLSGSGTTVINGDNIVSGTITGTTLVSRASDSPDWVPDPENKTVRVRNGHIELGYNLGQTPGTIVGNIYVSGSGTNAYIGIDAPEIHLDGNIYMNGVLVSQA